MTSTITFCMENPIRTPVSDWMAHIDRASVGRLVDNNHFDILAYSDNRADFPELNRIALKNDAVYIKSFISEGVTAID